MRRFGKRWFWITGTVLWITLVTVGVAGIARYSMTPGAQPVASTNWPSNVPFQPTARPITVVMNLHPQCPCSRATIAELSKLLGSYPDKISVYLLFVQPPGATGDWNRGPIFDAARALPQARVMTDVHGAWSRSFGAQTSGQTFAFDSDGRLLFSGGITAARGHEGDNLGSRAIAAILHGDKAGQGDGSPKSTQVFGCPLGISAGISVRDECERHEQ